MPALGNTIRWGKECARAGPWPADSSVAFLVPVPDGAKASAEFVRRCLGLLAEQGFKRVVTAALPPDEQVGFLEAGFNVHEHLHLLVLDKDAPLPPVPPGPALHRAGPLRRRGLLRVDQASFAPFWRLDRHGLRDAMEATQQRHLRVVLGVRRKVVGYAICGASEGRGFVQRLAVLPEAQGQGIGKRLLLDGLHWLRDHNAQHIVVNTQMGNEAALTLYRKVGFRDDPAGLSVLSACLSRP
ncbi:MAG TPA: GNAT family N-acetyltransferase [Acidimicrobiales bacterium]|nr:GNAT family N-acetyltransferase [Acidimicrobiales bacterium]